MRKLKGCHTWLVSVELEYWFGSNRYSEVATFFFPFCMQPGGCSDFSRHTLTPFLSLCCQRLVGRGRGAART